MFDKRKNVIASVTTIGTIAILLAACTNYDDVFEDNFGYGQSSKGVEFNGSTLKDLRDNHTYDVAQVGSLYWMMQDLSYEYYSTGKDYYLITACPKMYVKDEPNCDETGFLYPGQRLEHACPEGWRLPDVYEWEVFYNSAIFKRGFRSSYKGYIGGDKSQNKYGEAAYYWASTLFGTGSYKDCVSFTSEEDSFESVGRCHEQWKLAVRCVKDVGEEITESSSSLSMNEKFSSIFFSSSSSIYTTNTSSSNTPSSSSVYKTSSSSNTPSSSSVYTTSTSSINTSSSFSVDRCGDLWCGAIDTEGQVETGSENTETAGYWYDCNDAGKDHTGNSLSFCESEKGSSVFEFPTDVEPNEYNNFFGPLTEAYRGIKGSVVLGDSYDYPYAYLAFNLEGESLEGMDISAWGGICLVYESTIGFSIELVPENEQDVTVYNNYKAGVAKSSSVSSFDYPWNKFTQESGWGKSVDQSAILSDVATIRIKFTGPAGTTGSFNIRSIGRLGTCN